MFYPGFSGYIHYYLQRPVSKQLLINVFNHLWFTYMFFFNLCLVDHRPILCKSAGKRRSWKSISNIPRGQGLCPATHLLHSATVEVPITGCVLRIRYLRSTVMFNGAGQPSQFTHRDNHIPMIKNMLCKQSYTLCQYYTKT